MRSCLRTKANQIDEMIIFDSNDKLSAVAKFRKMLKFGVALIHSSCWSTFVFLSGPPSAGESSNDIRSLGLCVACETGGKWNKLPGCQQRIFTSAWSRQHCTVGRPFSLFPCISYFRAVLRYDDGHSGQKCIADLFELWLTIISKLRDAEEKWNLDKTLWNFLRGCVFIRFALHSGRPLYGPSPPRHLRGVPLEIIKIVCLSSVCVSEPMEMKLHDIEVWPPVLGIFVQIVC